MNSYHQFYLASALTPKELTPIDPSDPSPVLDPSPPTEPTAPPILEDDNTIPSSTGSGGATINIYDGNIVGRTTSLPLSTAILAEAVTQGGGMGGFGEDSREGITVKQRTIIPLVVIAAGIAILILKPFK